MGTKEKKPMRLTLQQMRYVGKVAQAGSLTEAAKQLSVSQAALSTSISQLEAELGIELFVRKGRGFVLTDDGKKFLILSERVLNDVGEIERRFYEGMASSYELNVITMPFMLTEKSFTMYLDSLSKKPLWYSMEAAKPSRVVKDVGAGVKNLGVMYEIKSIKRQLERLYESCDVEFHELVSLPKGVYLTANHPLADRKMVTQEELSSHPCFSFDQYLYFRLIGSNDAYDPTVEWRNGILVSRDITAIDDILSDIDEVEGYTIWASAGKKACNPDVVRFIPLSSSETVTFGYVKKKGEELSELERGFLERYKTWLEE